jgi:hypothetical protein
MWRQEVLCSDFSYLWPSPSVLRWLWPAKYNQTHHRPLIGPAFMLARMVGGRKSKTIHFHRLS